MDLSLFTAFRCTKIRNKSNYILKSLQKKCQCYNHVILDCVRQKNVYMNVPAEFQNFDFRFI